MVLKISLTLSLFFELFYSSGQPSTPPKEATNHVVIGAFASRENAIHFTDEAKSNRLDAKFDLNPLRELYYVYVLNTDDRVSAFAEARKLRKESRYWDTWVFFGTLGEMLSASEAVAVNSKPATGFAEVTDDSGVVIEQPQEKGNVEQVAAEVKAYSMKEEPTGLDLDRLTSTAQTEEQKQHYQTLKEVKASISKLDESTKVIVVNDDDEGRQTLRSLGYDVEDGKPLTGFFDSKNNILLVNATESKADEPFHEGLKPVVKFLKRKNPELFESLAEKAMTIQHPTQGKTYGEIYATKEEALANVMADVSVGYFERSKDRKEEALNLMADVLKSLGVDTSIEQALSPVHLKTTASNLAIAVREATGFDAEGNRKFLFNIYNTRNLKKINGEVDLVAENGRKIASYEGNQPVLVKQADASGNIVLACEVLGYRKLLYKLNYDNPFLTAGVTKGDDDEAVVSFGLVRLEKGDIAVMYNVYFFKDAAVMRPESQYEINNLLDMMKENEKYRIMIHGHTNGNAAGKIITMGESKNYFSLKDTKEGRGSAKKLSEERATVISEYLADQGVESSRMEIKAWGGKRPLYDKNHSQAHTNVRVEIEIIDN